PTARSSSPPAATAARREPESSTGPTCAGGRRRPPPPSGAGSARRAPRRRTDRPRERPPGLRPLPTPERLDLAPADAGHPSPDRHRLRALAPAAPHLPPAWEPWLLLPQLYALRERGAVAEYGHRTAARAIGDFSDSLPGGR